MKYLFRPIQQTPHEVGEDQPDGKRLMKHARGHVSYGPYCRLDPGCYFGGFHVRALRSPAGAHAIHIDVCCRQAAEVLAERWYSGREILRGVAGLCGVPFALNSPAEEVEVRLWADGKGTFEVSGMLLFRTDLI